MNCFLRSDCEENCAAAGEALCCGKGSGSCAATTKKTVRRLQWCMARGICSAVAGDKGRGCSLVLRRRRKLHGGFCCGERQVRHLQRTESGATDGCICGIGGDKIARQFPLRGGVQGAFLQLEKMNVNKGSNSVLALTAQNCAAVTFARAGMEFAPLWLGNGCG